MVQGIPPREASDRLNIFQTRFDDIWRRFQIYSDGEELFGMSVTDYPDLARIKKELNLLQKLYGLYNTVMDCIDGYYDILWVDVDIEKINSELLDFQNKSVAKLCKFSTFLLHFAGVVSFPRLSRSGRPSTT